jgi:hypothetical protein
MFNSIPPHNRRTSTHTHIKAQNQAGATILKGWRDPGGANNWHFYLIDDDHNSNEDSLFPSDDKLVGMIVSNTNPHPVPLLPQAKPVRDSYWECIKHKKQPANTIQMTYCERLANGLVTTQ